MSIANGKRKLKDIHDRDSIEAPLSKSKKTSVSSSRLSLNRIGKGESLFCFFFFFSFLLL